MLKDKAYKYFIEQDNNCAESSLRAINEEYGLGLKDEDMKLVSAFGGGMGCGETCGALCGCMAALGSMAVDGRAHATEGFSAKCGQLYAQFVEKLGSANCLELKKLYRNDETRCLKTVELGLETFEAFAGENGLTEREN